MNHKYTETENREQGWFRALPKAELHCHLDGSLPAHTVRRMGKQAGLALPETEEELAAALTVPADCRSLKEYLNCFSLPISCLQTYDALYTAAYDTAKAAFEEGTIYLELRFAPAFSAHEGFTQEDVVRAVRDGLKKAEADLGMYTGILLCGMRHFEPEKNLEIPVLAEKFLGDGVCGIDLAGDEKAYPPELHSKMFSLASEMEIPFTIHGGECHSAENVRTCVLMGARRIGHGIAMAGAKEIEELCRERDVAVELCPTSNFQTKAVEKKSDYPIRRFLEQGLAVTVNTDNRTVSGTSMTEELYLLHSQFGLTKEEAVQVTENAVRAAFAREEVKKALLGKLKAFWRGTGHPSER